MPSLKRRPRTRAPRTRSFHRRTPWGLRSWRLILFAVWFGGIIPLALLLRGLRPKPRAAFLLWWLLALVLIAASQLAILTLPCRWEVTAWIQLIWSLAIGGACAMAAQTAARRGWLERPHVSAVAPQSWRATWRSAAGCGLLMYCVVLTDVTIISMITKAFDQSTRQPLSPMVLWWSGPGFPVGLVLGALWQRRTGGVTGKILTNFLIGSHVVTIGMRLVLWLLSRAYRIIQPPASVHLYHVDWAVTRGAALVLFAPVLWYAYYVSLAGRIRSVFGRAIVCLSLFVLSFVQVAIGTGDHGLWYRYMATRYERAESAAQAGRAIHHWVRYLRMFPDTDERAEALWRIATTAARLNRDDDALAAFGALAHLPPTASGQYWVRQAALILQHHGTLSVGRRRELPVVPVTEAADYLDGGWRSMLSFARAARPDVSSADFLVNLRRVSLASNQLILPPLTNLFEVKTYGNILGVPITVQPLSLDDIKAQLDSGKPVLVPYQDQWWCVIGYDARWGTLLYYDYGRETEGLRTSHQRAEAKATLTENEVASRARLRPLQHALVEEVAEDVIAQTLRDHQQLAAILGSPQHTAAAAGWDAFLIGELAFQADDPMLAVEAYAESLVGVPDPGTILPYLHAARLTIERPPREIMEQRLPLNDLAETFAQWRRESGHEALLDRARAAVEHAPLTQLPSLVLERLAGTHEVNNPADRPLLIQLYEILHQRYPEAETYLSALEEAYRKQGQWEGVAATLQQLALLKPDDEAYGLRLADAQLHLDRPRDAEATLHTVKGRIKRKAAPRYYALAGRAARASGRYHDAVALLHQALENNLADPELRCELALAYEGLGHRQQALAEWRWVELAGVDPNQLALARQRLGEPTTP